MKRLAAPPWLPWAFAASALLNVAALVYAHQTGGIRRLGLRLNLIEPSVTPATYMIDEEARFRKIPATPAEVVFVGDSLIAAGPWAEFFSEVHNRGIGGNTTGQVLHRLGEVTDGRPRKVFILAGANDLAAGVPPTQVVANHRAILERIRAESPATRIYLIGVLPVNLTQPTIATYSNETVAATNRGLAVMVRATPGVTFVDLTRDLVDEAGALRRSFTPDGMHLNIDGYLSIRPALLPSVAEAVPTGRPEEPKQP